MALNTKITNAVAIAMCDAAVDALDGGTGAAIVRIYDGSQPTDPDTAVSGQTLLATLVCSDPAFGNAADNTGKATATANSITDDSGADATGTAAWFRAFSTNDGATPLNAIIDGTVGTVGADLNLNTVSLVSGVAVSVSAWTVNVSES